MNSQTATSTARIDSPESPYPAAPRHLARAQYRSRRRMWCSWWPAGRQAESRAGADARCLTRRAAFARRRRAQREARRSLRHSGAVVGAADLTSAFRPSTRRYLASRVSRICRIAPRRRSPLLADFLNGSHAGGIASRSRFGNYLAVTVWPPSSTSSRSRVAKTYIGNGLFSPHHAAARALLRRRARPIDSGGAGGRRCGRCEERTWASPRRSQPADDRVVTFACVSIRGAHRRVCCDLG